MCSTNWRIFFYNYPEDWIRWQKARSRLCTTGCSEKCWSFRGLRKVSMKYETLGFIGLKKQRSLCKYKARSSTEALKFWRAAADVPSGTSTHRHKGNTPKWEEDTAKSIESHWNEFSHRGDLDEESCYPVKELTPRFPRTDSIRRVLSPRVSPLTA